MRRFRFIALRFQAIASLLHVREHGGVEARMNLVHRLLGVETIERSLDAGVAPREARHCFLVEVAPPTRERLRGGRAVPRPGSTRAGSASKVVPHASGARNRLSRRW